MTTYREQDKVAELERENEELRGKLDKIETAEAKKRQKAKELKEYDEEESGSRVFTYLLVAVVIGAVIYYIATREDPRAHDVPLHPVSGQVESR